MVRIRSIVMVLAVVMAGCDAVAPLTSRSEDAVLYLVLTRDSIVQANPTLPGETRLTAALVTAGVPSRVEFRTAQEFAMWRESDGARFAWRRIPAAELDTTRLASLAPRSGNYVLAERAMNDSLGRADLRGGERYHLRVVTDGRVITGEAVLPERPVLIFVDDRERPRVVWASVRGAAAYLISQSSDGTWERVTSDTFHVVAPYDLAQPAHLRVTAVDANMAAFLRDTSVAAAGVVGAYGLFGGSAQAEIILPAAPGAQ